MNNKRWLLPAALLSAVLNVALLGFIAGQASSSGPRPPLTDPLRNMGRVMSQLPEERRELLKPVLHHHLQSMRSGMREVRSSQRQLNETLAGAEVDQVELQQALEAFHDSLCRSMADGHESFIELALAMTPEERVLLMKQMRPERRSPRPGAPGDRHFPGQRPPDDGHSQDR